MRASRFPRPPVDAIAVLSAARGETGAIETGPAQLTLDSATLQPVDDLVLDVDLLEERGSDVRVGVRLPYARFAVWTSRARMLAIVTRTHAVSAQPGVEHASQTSEGPVEVVLKPGARVVRLEQQGPWSKIRYAEYVEIVGWLPDSALAESAAPVVLRAGSSRRSVMLMPGTPFFASTRPGARALAVSRYTLVGDQLPSVDDAWNELRYEDTNVRVHGYVAKRPHPMGYSRRREVDSRGPLSTNVTVAANTCLFAGGEPVGFIVNPLPVLLEPTTRARSHTLTFDSPWGPLSFDARGPTTTDLETCGTSP